MKSSHSIIIVLCLQIVQLCYSEEEPASAGEINQEDFHLIDSAVVKYSRQNGLLGVPIHTPVALQCKIIDENNKKLIVLSVNGNEAGKAYEMSFIDTDGGKSKMEVNSIVNALAFETYGGGKLLKPAVVLIKIGEKYDDLLNDVLQYYLRNEYDYYNLCYAILGAIKSADTADSLYRSYNRNFRRFAYWMALQNTFPEPVRTKYLISPEGFALSKEYLGKATKASLYDKIREIVHNPLIVNTPLFKETKFFKDFQSMPQEKQQ